jgi:small subunit ribosomal protein S20
MSNIKSQIKRNRQNEAERPRNQAIRSEMRTKTRQAIAAAESGDTDAAHEALRLAQQRVDTAAARGVLHKKTAARRKARLHRQVESLLG